MKKEEKEIGPWEIFKEKFPGFGQGVFEMICARKIFNLKLSGLLVGEGIDLYDLEPRLKTELVNFINELTEEDLVAITFYPPEKSDDKRIKRALSGINPRITERNKKR